MTKDPNSMESRFGNQMIPASVGINRSFSKSSGFKVYNAMGLLDG